MSNVIVKQLEQVRGWTLEVASATPENLANIIPEGFPNNIKWQLGHILASTEYFWFTLPLDTSHLPENYLTYFNTGTSPGDWIGDIPKLETLISDLELQLERIKEISDHCYQEKLLKPLHGFTLLEDSAAFSVLHEALHVGKIEEMKRVLTNRG